MKLSPKVSTPFHKESQKLAASDAFRVGAQYAENWYEQQKIEMARTEDAILCVCVYMHELSPITIFLSLSISAILIQNYIA